VPGKECSPQMNRKELRQLLRQHPDFEQWLLQDSERLDSVRNNPASAGDLFKRWNDRKKGSIDFQGISEKTKRASEVLGNVQTIMEKISDYNKKQAKK
jgi:predicted CopG family antitoxin